MSTSLSFGWVHDCSISAESIGKTLDEAAETSRCRQCKRPSESTDNIAISVASPPNSPVIGVPDNGVDEGTQVDKPERDADTAGWKVAQDPESPERKDDEEGTDSSKDGECNGIGLVNTRVAGSRIRDVV